MKKILTIIIISLFIMSCQHEYVECPAEHIKFNFGPNSSATFQGYYYQGSDTNFHYFVSEWKYGDDYFKISTKHLTLNASQSLDEPKVLISRWRRIQKKKYESVLFTKDGITVYTHKQR